MKEVEFIGFEDLEKDIMNQIGDKMLPFVNKYKRIFGKEVIQDFKVDLETFKKDGGNDLHKLTMRLDTTEGNFRANKDGWNILTLVDEVESNLERQVKEKRDRMLVERAGRNA